MILPILAYGDPILKREAEDIEEGFPDLKELIDNMFETMYEASGIGLAAPQIGKSIRLFIVDGSPFAYDHEEDEKEDPRAVGMKIFLKFSSIQSSKVRQERNGGFQKDASQFQQSEKKFFVMRQF